MMPQLPKQPAQICLGQILALGNFGKRHGTRLTIFGEVAHRHDRISTTRCEFQTRYSRRLPRGI